GEFLEERLYLFEEKYNELVEKQKNKPHYIPEREDLLKFAELNYWEKPEEYEELEAYIQMNFFSENEKIGRIIADEIFEHIQMDKFDSAMQIFDHYEIFFENIEASDP